MSLSERIRPAAGDPEGALVLFHGRGADEHDLFPLLDLLDPERRLLGATARGPLSLPPGGAHWYIVRRVGFPDADTFRSTYEEAGGWVDDLLARHDVRPGDAVLGGFSQGGVMSYALARIVRWAEVDDLWNGALVGLLVWVGFVATVLAVTNYFGGRPRALWFINAGYQLVALLIMGGILGGWT